MSSGGSGPVVSAGHRDNSQTSSLKAGPLNVVLPHSPNLISPSLIIHHPFLNTVFVCYQAQQVQEEVRMLPDQVVCLTTQVHKVMEATGWFVSSVDDVRHVRGKDKGGAVSAQVTNHSPD